MTQQPTPRSLITDEPWKQERMVEDCERARVALWVEESS